MNNNIPGDESDVSTDASKSNEQSIESRRGWTRSFIAIYPDIDSAKRGARLSSLPIFILTGFTAWTYYSYTSGTALVIGMIISAVLFLSAIGIYLLFLPAAYIGLIVFVLDRGLGLALLVVSTGFSSLRWQDVFIFIVFIWLFYGSISAISQHKRLLEENSVQ